MRSQGLVRTYELRLPPSYDESTPAPLIIAFHGSPDQGIPFAGRIGLDSAAHEAGFITAYPDGINSTWIPPDATFVRTLIRQLLGGLAVDERRVYVTGFSIGGQITHWLACDLADVLAGAASVGATMGRGSREDCDPSRPMPMVMIHGTSDPVFPWEGQSVGGTGRLSVAETVEVWLDFNRCVKNPGIESLRDVEDDGTTVRKENYLQCAGGTDVILYVVEGGGHTWPGGPGPFPEFAGRTSRDISASEEIVKFFGRHARDPS